MKAERFIKEYANYELSNRPKSEKASYKKKVDRVIELRERGMITACESLKVLMGEYD